MSTGRGQRKTQISGKCKDDIEAPIISSLTNVDEMLSAVRDYWHNTQKSQNALEESISSKPDELDFGNEVEFMDLFINRGERFHSLRLIDFRVFQKSINRYMYIPDKSGGATLTVSKIKRCIQYNYLKLNFLKIRTQLFS